MKVLLLIMYSSSIANIEFCGFAGW